MDVLSIPKFTIVKTKGLSKLEREDRITMGPTETYLSSKLYTPDTKDKGNS